jgi:hypothetical protein
MGEVRFPTSVFLPLEGVCSFLFCRPVCEMVKQYAQYATAIDKWRTYVESFGSSDSEVSDVFLDRRYLTNPRQANRSGVAERRIL